MDDVKGLLRSGVAQWGLTLDDPALYLFQRYYSLLLEWNRRVNLTALAGAREVALKHFVDSLSCLVVHTPHTGARVADVGTGAGFPGVPVKIVRPDIKLTLIESVGKKVAFLKELVKNLALSGVDVICGRAEELAHQQEFREIFDLTLSRAVAPLPVLLEYCLPLLRPGGLLLALKGPAVDEEIQKSTTALKILKGNIQQIQLLELPFTADQRRVVLVKKTGITPGNYPRRPGLPLKRPL